MPKRVSARFSTSVTRNGKVSDGHLANHDRLVAMTGCRDRIAGDHDGSCHPDSRDPGQRMSSHPNLKFVSFFSAHRTNFRFKKVTSKSMF